MHKNLLINQALKIVSLYPMSLFISLISFAVMFYAPESLTLLRYESLKVNDGEFWRIITSNFCHSNWNHWMLNIAGLWLMDIFYKPVLSQKLRVYLLSFCILLNVLMLHWFMDLYWYVGLSGALHGYLIGGALLSWKSAKWVNLIIIVFTVGKLITESFWQINSETEKLINANVVEEAHIFGAVSALVFFVLYLISKYFNIIQDEIRNVKKG